MPHIFYALSTRFPAPVSVLRQLEAVMLW